MILSLLVTSLAALPSPQEASPLTQILAEHEEWLEGFASVPLLESGGLQRLQQRLGTIVRLTPSSRERLRPAASAVLRTAAFGLTGYPRRADFMGGSDVQRVRRAGYGAVTDLILGPRRDVFLDWLAEEVLPMADHPLGPRALALSCLDQHRSARGQMAALAIARSEDDKLRTAALQVLATWPGEAVDLYLVGLIGKKFDKTRPPHPFNVLLERVRGNEEPLSERAVAVLEQRLAPMLISTDWREASRAIELSRGFEMRRAIPILLDALAAWSRRTELGGGSKRIVDEIVRELRRRSGRSIGPSSKAWSRWWVAYQQGRVDHVDEDGEDGRSRATFFGLRPVSDRVTFVIDFSGSMTTEWGTAEHSRYQEAIEQMMRFLQAAGEATRFNVILFSDEPLRSSPELVRATAETLERARSSLLPRTPDGGTYLRPAIELALRLDASGGIDPDRLEADTIIVLCDGETTDGPRWVKPLLNRVQAEARVVFHCVLIGTRGDGTLETLSKTTGGDYIRIGG